MQGRDFELGCCLDYVLLVGLEEPSVRATAQEARMIFERVKARLYLERLDAAMAGQARVDAPAEVRGSGTVSGTPS